jgi:hypothetical protein
MSILRDSRVLQPAPISIGAGYDCHWQTVPSTQLFLLHREGLMGCADTGSGRDHGDDDDGKEGRSIMYQWRSSAQCLLEASPGTLRRDSNASAVVDLKSDGAFPLCVSGLLPAVRHRFRFRCASSAPPCPRDAIDTSVAVGPDPQVAQVQWPSWRASCITHWIRTPDSIPEPPTRLICSSSSIDSVDVTFFPARCNGCPITGFAFSVARASGSSPTGSAMDRRSNDCESLSASVGDSQSMLLWRPWKNVTRLSRASMYVQ